MNVPERIRIFLTGEVGQRALEFRHAGNMAKLVKHAYGVLEEPLPPKAELDELVSALTAEQVATTVAATGNSRSHPGEPKTQ